MQSVPESRQQSFEEIYGPPENFLEIEVSRFVHDCPTRSPKPSSIPVPRGVMCPHLSPKHTHLHLHLLEKYIHLDQKTNQNN
jgi:hypothetical protein